MPQTIETVAAVRAAWPQRPDVGIILGTGASEVVANWQVDTSIAYADLPHMLPPTAVGHAGQFVGAKCGETVAAVLQGRVHLYEGYCVDQVQYPVHVLAALGVPTLIVTNAAGGLNPRFRSGDIVVLDDQMDVTCGGAGAADQAIVEQQHIRTTNGGHACTSDATYSRRLGDTSISLGRRAGITVHRGTYIGVTGPNYETRAEYRFYRKLGDVIGMSTVHEATAARQHGMQVLGLSVVTNECNPDALMPTSGDAVVLAGQQAAANLAKLIQQICGAL